MISANGDAPSPDYAQLQARVRDLEAALHQNDLDLALAFDLTPKLSDLLGLLLSLKIVTSDIIRKKLEIATDAKVAIHRLRLHMKNYGVQIEGRRGFGYWLTEETKNAIKRRITQEVTDELPEEHHKQ